MTNDLDMLWPHFAPLWVDLRKITPSILLSGGYALLLKQRWLLSNVGIVTIVNVRQWHNQIPRSTKDFDFIAEVSLIASPDHQRNLDALLNLYGYKVVEENARWQFARQLDPNHSVLLDFHTPTPTEPRSDIRIESRRVKPQPSLQNTGIHGRENREAAGCELHPCVFLWQGFDVAIPNPVTQSMMKLTAMRDRWSRSQDAALRPDQRRMEEGEAKKHAADVCRVVAMTTREEHAFTPDVIATIRTSAAFAQARSIFAEYFETDMGPAFQFLSQTWRREHLVTIRSTLAAWFVE